LHIAIATVNDLDMIVSMNFKHIVKRKTILAAGKINNLNGYRAIEIYSPMEAKYGFKIISSANERASHKDFG